jgi:uncharacterized protein (DUF1800 family)
MTVPATAVNAAHLMRRAGFGGSPADIARVERDGIPATVDRLLTFEPYGDAPPASFANAGTSDYQRLTDLQGWWIDRMAFGPNPLQEKLTLFWHNHFATSNDKVQDPAYMHGQNATQRALCTGVFDDLVMAMAKDPAMLVWLDSNQNTKAHPNENFGRELMELFTRGVNTYTQDDVVAAARSFTGWFLDRTTRQFSFNPTKHDAGPKTFLGQTGDWDGADIIRMCVTSPESAAFVCTKLWKWFAGPPDSAAIADLVATWNGSGRNIGDVVRVMLTHPAFYSDACRDGLVKQPAEWLAGAQRALHLPSDQAHPYWWMDDLGQQLFRPPDVGGWHQNEAWLSTASASARGDFANNATYAALKLGGTPYLQEMAEMPPADAVSRIFGRLGIVAVSGQTRSALAAYLVADRTAGGWRPGQIWALVRLALLSPDYLMN